MRRGEEMPRKLGRSNSPRPQVGAQALRLDTGYSGLVVSQMRQALSDATQEMAA